MRVGLMSAAESTIFYGITKMAVRLLNVHKKVNHLCWNSCSCLERGPRPHALFLDELCGLALLKARTKDETVTEQLLGFLNQAWALCFDGTLDEGESAEDIRTVISEMPPPSQSGSMAAAPALAS